MKNLLLSTALLLMLPVACRSDDSIGPSSLLYKRWHLFQTRGVKDSTWLMYDTDAYYDTEYRPDGTLLYRRNGTITTGPCCAVNRFERSGVIIAYSEFIACPNVRCSPGVSATITTLKEDLLELQTESQLTQYTPTP